jgi:putative hydrolase of the HAD superfamily
MTSPFRETILRHCRPADPIPTGHPARLDQLSGVRAVLFDIYGTMLISASGEVGTAADEQKSRAFAEALAVAELTASGGHTSGGQTLVETIRRHHARSRARGVEYPEVEIRQVWRDVLEEMGARGRNGEPPDDTRIEQLAVEYEVRTNPVWPMPHLAACLADLKARGLDLGIVSNAQFFTPLLFPALLDRDLKTLGFPLPLQIFSFEFGQAKPGTYLYERAAEALSSRSIRADEVVYVGNDVLNDVGPAGQLGFRTALFAGDARSLRLREGDPRVAGVEPDLVVTDLNQLTQCIRN